jgi:hypothetical protein
MDWLGVVLSGVITAAGAAYVLIANARHRNNLEDKKAQMDEEESAIDKWKELYGLQQEQIEGMQRHSRSQDELINELVEAVQDCELERLDQYNMNVMYHDAMRRYGERHPDENIEIPKLPKKPVPRRRHKLLEFRQRQSAQDTATLEGINVEISKKANAVTKTETET